MCACELKARERREMLKEVTGNRELVLAKDQVQREDWWDKWRQRRLTVADTDVKLNEK